MRRPPFVPLSPNSSPRLRVSRKRTGFGASCAGESVRRWCDAGRSGSATPDAADSVRRAHRRIGAGRRRP